MSIDVATSQASFRNFFEQPHKDPVTGEKLRLVIDKNERGEKCLKWRPLGIGEKVLRFFGAGNGCFKNVVEFAMANNILADAGTQELRDRLYTVMNTYNHDHNWLRSILRVDAKTVIQPAETPAQAFLRALENREPARAKFLLEYGEKERSLFHEEKFPIGFKGNDFNKALQTAAREGYVDIVKALNTPLLHYTYFQDALETAVVNGKKDVVEVLIKSRSTGASFYLTEGTDNIFHVAVKNYNEEIFETLTNHYLAGRPWLASARNKEGQTPLHLAVQYGNRKALLHLLRCVGPNITNINHNTPLHAAAIYGNIAIAGCLLSYPGTERNLKNADRYTPLDLAMRNQPENRALIEMLKECGCVRGIDMKDPV